MVIIEKLKLLNFKRFQELILTFDKDSNTIIGDNESGKSTVLLALDLVLSGSRTKIDNIGFEFLFNKNCIEGFFKTNKHPKKLPELYVELYFNEQNNEDLNGNNNSEKRNCDGLRLKICPDDNYMNE
jgi:predicted ATP-dependent endonuclease of OLD family